jgi:biotin synthase
VRSDNNYKGLSNLNMKDNLILKQLENGIFTADILMSAMAFGNEDQDSLFELARKKRDEKFPNKEVELRSVIEISNKCRQKCNYCAIGKEGVQEYALDDQSIVSLTEHIYNKGRRVVLIQSGENGDQKYIDDVSRSLEIIKDRFEDLVIILCLGNLKKEQYLQLHSAGAERYILKFETSNPELFRSAKPHDTLDNRLRCLDNLLDVGFSVGSGNIVGLPGQTLNDIANDLFLLHKYDLTMNSASMFTASEGSKYKDEPYGNIDTTLNTMALMRIMNPARLMPTTSSLEKAKPGMQLKGLMAGANTVTIHDGTPDELKPFFPMYSMNRINPQKDHIKDIVEKAHMKLLTGWL